MPSIVTPTELGINVDAADQQLWSDRANWVLDRAESLVRHEWNATLPTAGTDAHELLRTVVAASATRVFYNPAGDDSVSLGEFTRRPGSVYLRQDEKEMIAEARRRFLGVNAPRRVRSVQLVAYPEATP